MLVQNERKKIILAGFVRAVLFLVNETASSHTTLSNLVYDVTI